MDSNSKKVENVQIKLITLSKDRQVQISELKSYFQKNNKIFYKDIVLLNTDLIYEIFPSKIEYKWRYLFLYNIINFLE